jgi:predicted anti-sigma-YlaC factor YlaD
VLIVYFQSIPKKVLGLNHIILKGLYMKKLLLLLLATLSLNSCQKIIVGKLSDALSQEGEGSIFTRDNDPELIRDALPLALKMYEGLLEANPEDVPLHRATASAFCAYSYAFIHFPADTITDDPDTKKVMHKRAKKMYIRARDYALDGLELRYPGFRKGLGNNADSTLAQTTKEDASILYWAGLSWMGAFTVDKFDMRLAISVPKAIKIMKRVEELNPDYGKGAIDEFLISYYGAMPKSMGGDKAKAKEHFERAVKLTEGNSAGPYLALATAVAIPTQDGELFDELIKKANKIKPESDKNSLLLRTIQKEKALWLKKNRDDFFVE